MHFVRDCTGLWNCFARLKIGQWNLHTLPQQAEGLRTIIKLRLISRSIRRAPTSCIFVHWVVLSVGLFWPLGSFGHWAVLAIRQFWPLGHFGHLAVLAIEHGHWASLAIRPFLPSGTLGYRRSGEKIPDFVEIAYLMSFPVRA